MYLKFNLICMLAVLLHTCVYECSLYFLNAFIGCIIFVLFMRIDLFAFASVAVDSASYCRDKFLFDAFVFLSIDRFLIQFCFHPEWDWQRIFRFYIFACSLSTRAKFKCIFPVAVLAPHEKKHQHSAQPMQILSE